MVAPRLYLCAEIWLAGGDYIILHFECKSRRFACRHLCAPGPSVHKAMHTMDYLLWQAKIPTYFTT